TRGLRVATSALAVTAENGHSDCWTPPIHGVNQISAERRHVEDVSRTRVFPPAGPPRCGLVVTTTAPRVASGRLNSGAESAVSVAVGSPCRGTKLALSTRRKGATPMRYVRLLALVLALILIVLPRSSAGAGALNVPQDYPTIQAAINAAVNGDT